ncbi:glycosyltransferase family 2 protein [Chloroflexota bacterium]
MELTEKVAKKPKITVLICTLNEEPNLPNLLPKIPEWVDEVLLVDGRGTDNTVNVAYQLRPDIHLLYQPSKGKGDALRYGIKHANGDIIVTLDADNATDPDEIGKFIAPLLRGYDFAKGSRFAIGFPCNKPWYRILGNWIIVLTFDILFFRKYTDLCSGYNAFWREAIERVNLWSPDGFEDEPLINLRVRKTRLKVIEVGHLDNGRYMGNSKASSWRQGFKAIKSILRERFRG